MCWAIAVASGLNGRSVRRLIACAALVATCVHLGGSSGLSQQRPSGIESNSMAALPSGVLAGRYRAEAESTRWLRVAGYRCDGSKQGMVGLVERALEDFTRASRYSGPFVRMVRLAARAGALDLYLLGWDETGQPGFGSAGWPCIAAVRVLNSANGPLLAVSVDRRSYPQDIVAMNRCLFKDIELGFTYRIDRTPDDDPQTRVCPPSPGTSGLCRPSCADVRS